MYGLAPGPSPHDLARRHVCVLSDLDHSNQCRAGGPDSCLPPSVRWSQIWSPISLNQVEKMRPNETLEEPEPPLTSPNKSMKTVVAQHITTHKLGRPTIGDRSQGKLTMAAALDHLKLRP